MEQKSLIKRKDNIIVRLKNKIIEFFSRKKKEPISVIEPEIKDDYLNSDEGYNYNIFSFDDIYDEQDDLAYADENSSSSKLEPMITDKESYDLVMGKLKSGEITENEPAISDLLKINLMLSSEIELKMDKYDIEEKMKYDKQIEDLKKEISILEKKVNI